MTRVPTPRFPLESYRVSALTDASVQVDYLGCKVKTEWVVKTWAWRRKGHALACPHLTPATPLPQWRGFRVGGKSPVWGLTCAGQGLLSAIQLSEGSVTMPSCSQWPIEPHSGTTRLKLQDPQWTESAMTFTSYANQRQLAGCATCAAAQASRLEEPSLL